MIEYIDIYDSNRQKTGKIIPRKGATLSEGEYQLYTISICQNWDGKFLITQRVMTKAWAPGSWEVSGGGVMAGETSAQAIQREIWEETGLDVTGAKGGYLFSYQRINPDEGDNYFVDIYRFDMDVKEEDVHIQTAEAMGFQFADLDTIKKLAEQDKFLHYNSIKQAFEA